MRKILLIGLFLILAAASPAATVRWLGNATAVAQVERYDAGTVEVGDIFTLTVTGLDGVTKAISFTATAATADNVEDGLAAAWNASTNSNCTPVTADPNYHIVMTADTAGNAFSITASTTDGGGNDTQTLSKTTITANAGPQDWSSTDNWSGGALPGGAASQDVYINGATILYGLDQSGISNTLDSLNIQQSQIGSNPAAGYLPTYLQIKVTAVNIGAFYGPGTPSESAPINIDTGSTASTIAVYNTGTNSTQPACRIKANSGSTNIRVLKGSVGIAYEDGETTTIGTLTSSYTSRPTSDADIFIGSGVTMTTLSQTGGGVVLQCGLTTATSEAGTLETAGSGAITTLNAKGATCTLNSTGTITTLNITGGSVDFSKSAGGRTVTTLKLDSGGKLIYDPSIVTLTNKVDSDNAVTLTATEG